MSARRALCSDLSRERDEPLLATASRVDLWLLVEYSGAWARDAVDGSALSPALKAHLGAQLAARPHAKVLFIRRRTSRHQRRVAVFVASSRERDPWMVSLELERHDELLDLDLGRARAVGRSLSGPLLAVCTHGKHDRCCALHGRRLYDELRAGPEADRVWQASHVGGDRFAGNVVSLPEGLYHGRVAPGEAPMLLDRLRAREVLLDRYRGRSCHPFPVQAAEHEIRRSRSLAGIDALRLTEASRDGDDWRVAFREPATGAEHRVVVERGERDAALLTCSASIARRAPSYRVRPSAGSPRARGA